MVKIDIEMPTYCYDCPCHNGENGRCNITGDSVYDKRPFDCPLKEEKDKMNDSISRQDAINELVRWGTVPDYNDGEKNVIGCGIAMLSALPSAQPERKTGKWIEYNATGKKQWMCSECCAEEKNPKVARFCYWCGADMRGEQNDQ